MEPLPHSKMVEVLRELYDHKDQFKDKIGKFSGRLDYQDSLLIWQYVRFNPLYQSMYDKIKRSDLSSLEQYGLEDDDIVTNTMADLGKEWCLFPHAIDYNVETLPENHYFEQIGVYKSFLPEVPFFPPANEEVEDIDHYSENWLNDQAIRREVFENDLDISILPPDPVGIIINPLCNKKELFKSIEAIIDKYNKRYIKNHPHIKDSISIDPKGSSSLVENLTIFFLKQVKKVQTAKDVTNEYYDILEAAKEEDKNRAALQATQIKKKVETFKKYSASSPWCFFFDPASTSK